MPDPLTGKRIALTGASGFVGGRIAAALAQRGSVVEGFGRRTCHAVSGGRYTAWDIAAGPLAAPPPVDALVHCAGLVTDWAPRREFVRCHVDGTRHVLETFPEPTPVVLVSSASVYDPFVSKRRCREDAPESTRHLNAYSETKALAELLVRYRTRHIVLRPHAIYGPGDRVLVPRILEARRGPFLIAAGNGSNLVSLTHVDNLVDAVGLALAELLTGEARGVFNISDEQPVRMDAVLRELLVVCGHEPRVIFLPRALAYPAGAVMEALGAVLRWERAPPLTRYRVAQVADDCALDLSRAKVLLGYRPTRDVHGYLASRRASTRDA